MNKKEIIIMLRKRIESCKNDMLHTAHHYPIPTDKRRDYFWCYYSRLDELLLTYQHIEDITFIEACKRLGIDYEKLEELKERFK